MVERCQENKTIFLQTHIFIINFGYVENVEKQGSGLFLVYTLGITKVSPVAL